MTVMARRKTGDAQSYDFPSPVAEAGRVFRVTSRTDDPACPKQEDGGQLWMPGKGLESLIPLPGNTSLEGCAVNKAPCAYVVVKGAFVRRGEPIQETAAAAAPEGAWVLQLQYNPGDLKTRIQRFRWGIELNDVHDIKLQASLFPFPKTAEDDYLAPPGLVASWDFHFGGECGNCEFVVPLKELDPSPAKGKSFFKKALDVGAAPFKAIGNGVSDLFGGGKKKTPDTVKAGKAQIPSQKTGDYLVGGSNSPLLKPTTFYFRVVPLKGGEPFGAPSNMVVLQEVPKFDIKFETTATPTPVALAYEAKILTYNGIIPPQKPDHNCYIVTQEAWPLGPYGLTYTTDKSKALAGFKSVKPGALICEPPPDEPSILDVILSFAEDTMDWASDAWQDLKQFAVDVVLKYTPLGAQCTALEDAGVIPDGACETALKITLDAVLVSAGIPPDLPNLDQAMKQGVEYFAAQTAAQVGIPPEVIKAATEQGGPYAGLALDVAEAKLRDEMEKQIEANLEGAVKSIQLAYAKKVGFVPDGIPVRPDDYLPPGMTVRVTRKGGVAGGDQGCVLTVRDSLKLSQDVLNNPPPELAGLIKGLPHPLSALTAYDLYGNEADYANGTNAGLDKQLAVPPLAPGEHFDIPLTFKPDFYKSGWSPSGLIQTSTYIQVWHVLHDLGTVTMFVGGTCGSDSLTLPAKAQTLSAEVVPVGP